MDSNVNEEFEMVQLDIEGEGWVWLSLIHKIDLIRKLHRSRLHSLKGDIEWVEKRFSSKNLMSIDKCLSNQFLFSISKPGEMSNAFSYTLLGGANLAASFEFAVKQSRVDRGATFVVQINDERINIREGTTNRRFYHTEAKKFCHKMADGNLIEVTLPVLYGSVGLSFLFLIAVSLF